MAVPDDGAGWQQRLQAAWLHRGWLARLLWPVSLLFCAAVRLRQGLFRLGLRRRTRLPVPVWVVGNLIVGGAGKTPTVLALCHWLRQQGHTPGIVSRGYKGRAEGVVAVGRDSDAVHVGDEPLLLHWRSGAPVFIGRRRVAAAQALLAAHPEVSIILSDDGLQHLPLHRDMQVILFDRRGAGNGWLLPAGPLREPMARRAPPRSIVVYHSSDRSTPWPGHAARSGLSGAVLWQAWRQGAAASPEALRDLTNSGRPLWAAAGIAQPERFFGMLRDHGLQVRPLPLPDHHDYRRLPWPQDAADVLVTEKDAVKLRPDPASPTRVWVVPLDFEIGPELRQALAAALPKTPHAQGRPATVH